MVNAGHLLNNDDGVNFAMEYILVFIIAMLVFTILISSAQSIFVDGPSKIVNKNQLNDVGNDISAKLIDTYMMAPDPQAKQYDSISISTTFDIPSDIAGNGYIVKVSDAPNGYDKEVTITSDKYTNDPVKLTLNGVSMTIPVSGYTSSHNIKHWINYTL